MRRHSSQSQAGFTIIELMLSLAFLSVLLLFVLSATVQVMRSYNKGLTTKQMNQTGRTITEEMSRTARTAWAESVVDESANGRLCVGGVSYVWNEPDVVGDTPITTNTFIGGGAVDIVRIDDSNAEYCRNIANDIPRPATDDRVSLLSTSSVRILNLRTQRSTDGRLLNIAFNVASTGTDKPVKVGTEYECPVDGSMLYGSFCAIADFETTIYLRNKNGG